MPKSRLIKLELQVLEAFWQKGACSVREVQEAFPEADKQLLAVLGGRARLVMAHLVESGELTLDDVKEAEKTLRKLPRKDKPQ